MSSAVCCCAANRCRTTDRLCRATFAGRRTVGHGRLTRLGKYTIAPIGLACGWRRLDTGYRRPGLQDRARTNREARGGLTSPEMGQSSSEDALNRGNRSRQRSCYRAFRLGMRIALLLSGQSRSQRPLLVPHEEFCSAAGSAHQNGKESATWNNLARNEHGRLLACAARNVGWRRPARHHRSRERHPDPVSSPGISEKLISRAIAAGLLRGFSC